MNALRRKTEQDIIVLRRKLRDNQGGIYLATNYHAAQNYRRAARRIANRRLIALSDQKKPST